MTPEEDKFWRWFISIAVLAAIGAFRPQIMRFLHRLGYRDWREKKDDTKPR